MKPTNSLSGLEAYARKRIAAEKYPNDIHISKRAECANCGVIPMKLTIEHHTGSKKKNFRGVIRAKCSQCGEQTRIFSFTGARRKPERKEKPSCKCGSNLFFVCELERIERDEGVPGFFDEGVVVGKCSECGKNQVFVYTD
jgi:hypothetical protein